MNQLILIIHLLVCVGLVVLVLLQHGKGADIGAAFGSGASNTVFGSQGSGGFLLKFTGVLAALFFVTSITLGYLAAHQPKPTGSVLLTAPAKKTMPAQSGPKSQIPAEQQPVPGNN